MQINPAKSLKFKSGKGFR